MTKADVLAWLHRQPARDFMFSDLSRALITNSKRERARSSEARAELHAILAALRNDGLVRLSPTQRSGYAGRPGVRIEVVQKEPLHPRNERSTR